MLSPLRHLLASIKSDEPLREGCSSLILCCQPPGFLSAFLLSDCLHNTGLISVPDIVPLQPWEQRLFNLWSLAHSTVHATFIFKTVFWKVVDWVWSPDLLFPYSLFVSTCPLLQCLMYMDILGLFLFCVLQSHTIINRIKWSSHEMWLSLLSLKSYKLSLRF
jgi:hypothetical protein